MNITFNIHYKTHFGQTILISGPKTELGNEIPENALKMNLVNADLGHWQLTLSLPESAEKIEYKYLVKYDNYFTVIPEWGENRCIEFKNKGDFSVYDAWRSSSDPRYALFNKAVSETIFGYENRYKPTDTEIKENIRLKFQISVPRVDNKHRVAIVGNITELGAWKTSKALLMSNENHPIWEVELGVNPQNFPIEYKYCIVDAKTKKAVFDEDTAPRIVSLPKNENKNLTIVAVDEHFSYPAQPWKCSGVAIPVFSLRRKNGCGVGEFSDIKLLVDWAKKTGMKVIQLLPVNDTIATHTWIDSYPYSGISVYALHPIYVNLSMIGALKAKVTQKIVEEQSQYLNDLDKIDYEAVMRLKARFFKQIYDEQQQSFLKDKDYITFFESNKEWLKPYAAFSYLRDLFNTADFSRWGKYSIFSPALIDEICNPKAAHFNDIAIHYFIQYHAHKQLLDAAEYARKKGVALKGDIPIGIYRNSVDAWVAPELYNMDAQAGAPPDDFSTIGQNWRFPTYNWEKMQEDNYQWWQQRLQKMADYFDAFRIDHILGFFRIWEIPESQVEGLMGRFNPSLPYNVDEMANRGMWFNYDRLCRPYIRQHFLHDFFGHYTDEVKNNYLEEYAPGCYNLKPQYDTQKKIEKALSLSPDADRNQRAKNEQIKLGLFALVAEVILLEAPNSQGKWFVPRNSMHFTHSYRELDNYSKEKLNELYIDYFYRRNEQFWAANAMKKLPIIKNSTNMLLCGEDLGMVPKCVPDIMNHLGILSLEVQRMPKQQELQFAHPNNYPYMSVATPSSHDTSTIRGWWEEDSTRSQIFFNTILGNWGNSPFFCETWIVKQILEQHLYSPSMLAVFPLQDLLGISDKLRFGNAQAERINQPANPTHYWRYRMHLSIEDLLNEEDFNNEIKGMIESSGRNTVY
jgi:4-alpha-glucanotransferase